MVELGLVLMWGVKRAIVLDNALARPRPVFYRLEVDCKLGTVHAQASEMDCKLGIVHAQASEANCKLGTVYAEASDIDNAARQYEQNVFSELIRS
jgi:hypothetical protein